MLQAELAAVTRSFEDLLVQAPPDRQDAVEDDDADDDLPTGGGGAAAGGDRDALQAPVSLPTGFRPMR